MEIKVQKEGNKGIYNIIGRLDTTTSPELEASLRENLPEIDELVLDFVDLEYISSAGLRVLLFAQKEINAKQGSMKLIHVSSEVNEVFDITGFSDILTIE